MLRYFKNKKHLQLIVILGLICPLVEQANPAFQLWLAWNQPLIEKIAGKAAQYIVSTALVGGILSRLQNGSGTNLNFINDNLKATVQQNIPAKQVVTQGMKTVAKKIATPADTAQIKTLINTTLTPIPAPANTPFVPRRVRTVSFTTSSTIPTSTPKVSTPSITIAVAPKQMATQTIQVSSTPVPSSITRMAACKIAHDKINQNSANLKIASSSRLSCPTTNAFKQSVAAMPSNSAQPNNINIKFEFIPGNNPGLLVGKDIVQVVEQAQSRQRFIDAFKPQLDAIQQKLNIASQQSSTPAIIKEQLSLVSHSIPQYSLNAELGVKKGMMLEHIFNRSGEFQGCYSTDTQKQLEEYANDNLYTWSYSAKRTWSWAVDKVKNIWASKKDLTEQIRTNPYNLNLYNFAVQFEAKNFEGAAHYLNLIRPDNSLDNSSKGVIYKNMYESFVKQFFDAKDPSTLADKMSMVCKDHSNPVIRNIFAQFFNESTIFKKYVSAYVKNYQDIQIPKEIATQKFTNLRTLYLKFITTQPANPQKAQQIRQGLLYIKEACSENAHSNVFNKLAHSVYKQLTSGTDATILNCRNFAHAFSSPEAQRIQQEILPLISKATEVLETTSLANTIDDNLKLSKKCAQELLSHANILYDALDQGDMTKARFIKEQVLPTLTPEYVKAHGSVLETMAAIIPTAPQPLSLTQQVLATQVLSSIPSLSSSINSPCSAIEDKSKNLQQNPGQCMPEVKIPVPECSMPNPLPPITSCGGSPTFKSEAERRIEAEIEASKNKPEKELEQRQCNWSQYKQILPFEDKVSQNDKAIEKYQEPSSSQEVTNKEAKQIVEKDKQKSENAKALELEETKEKLLRDIKNKVEELKNVYGSDLVIEASEILPLTDSNVKKYKNYLDKFTELIVDLKKINSNPRWMKFKYDSAHSAKTNIKTIDEAIAGIACEEQGILSELNRSDNNAEEFVQKIGGLTIAWDVKTFPSYTEDGKRYLFNVDKFIENIKKELRGKENVIVNVKYLSKYEVLALIVKLKSTFHTDEIKRVVFIDPKNQDFTKEISELLKN